MSDSERRRVPSSNANDELTRQEEEHEIVVELESPEREETTTSPHLPSVGSELEEEEESEIVVKPEEEQEEEEEEEEEAAENAVEQFAAKEGKATNKGHLGLRRPREPKAKGKGGARNLPNEAVPVPVHHSRGLQRTESDMDEKQNRQQERIRSSKPRYTGYFEEPDPQTPTNSGHMVVAEVVPTALQRATAIDNNSQPQLQPGAYPAGRSAWESYQNEDNDLEEGNETSNNSNSNLGSIPVANPVPDQGSNLELAEAQQVEDHQEGNTRISLIRSDILRIVMGAATLILAVALALALSLAGSSGSEDSSNETIPNKNTTAATALTPEEMFLNQLPFQTIQSIEFDSQSPQAKAMDWLIQDPSFDQYPVWRQVQRFALATFFYSTGGQDHWFLKRNWLDYSKHECDWFSFEYLSLDPEFNRYAEATYPSLGTGLCDFPQSWNEEVKRIALNTVGLRGSIPFEFSLLKQLRIFSTLDAGLTGTIPTEIGLLTNLEFFGAALARLSGEIPSEIGLATNLTHFLNFRTRISGTIPTELGRLTNMVVLMLDETALEGTMPSELGLLSNAIWMTTYEMDLKGPMPSQLGHLCSVRYLSMHGYGPGRKRQYINGFTGEIPSEIGLLSSVQHLELRHNNFNGPLPSELGQLSALQHFYFSHNKITGKLPSEIGLLAALQQLDGRDTRLAGPSAIPVELGQLSNLFELNLGYSHARTSPAIGRIPTILFQMTSLSYLDLENIFLTGPIPTQIGRLSNMTYLQLKDNRLTGAVPSELGLLTALMGLDLAENQLSGTIPPEIGLLTSIQGLALHVNQLTGTVPSELGLIAATKHLDLHENQLSGEIPRELGLLLTSLNRLTIGGNNLLHGNLSSEKLCSMGPERFLFDCSPPTLCGCSWCPCY